MLSHFREALHEYPTPNGLSAKEEQHPERRRRPRTLVHWPVLLFREHGDEVIETTTQNLSSCGFYCLLGSSVSAGESLFCRLHVPLPEAPRRKSFGVLECRVRVTRTEPALAEGLFGVACRIEDYRFIGPREPLDA
jgi:PilZ domain